MNRKNDVLKSVAQRARLNKSAYQQLTANDSTHLSPHHTVSVDLPCSLYTQLATYATEVGKHPNDQIARGLELYFTEMQRPTSSDSTPRTHTPSHDSSEQLRQLPDDVPVVQLNTRVALPYYRFIKKESLRTGQTVRSIIEGAIADKYGVPNLDEAEQT